MRTMSKAPLCVILMTSMIALAGCSGGGDDPTPADDAIDGSGLGTDFEGGAAITGSVVNDESLPVPGVLIGLAPPSLQATTGPDGTFAFRELADGQYQVFAQKLGYESAAQRVTIQGGADASVLITLEAITVNDVFHESIGPYVGNVPCGYSEPGIAGIKGSGTGGCPGQGYMEDAFGASENWFEFELQQDNVWAVVGEMRWTPSAYATSERFSLFLDLEGGSGFDWWCQGVGSSPIQFVYHIDEDKRQCTREGSGDTVQDPPNMEQTLALVAYVDFHIINPTQPETLPPNVALGQTYESMVTIFYGEDPQLPYTAFTDS